MYISFYLMVPLISLSIMLVTPHLNFYSNAIAIEDGSPEEYGFYNNYENDGLGTEGNSFYNNYENDGLGAEGNGFYNNYENAGSGGEGNGFYNDYEDGGIDS